MIILTGYSKSGNKKTLSLSRDRSKIVYQVDDVTIDTFDMTDAAAVCQELNNLVTVTEYDEYYINQLLSTAEQEGVTFKDIRNFYDALQRSSLKATDDPIKDLSEVEETNKQQEKKKSERLRYENKEAMLIDLRRHLDDVYNSYVNEYGIHDPDWFDWNHALYTSANYLEAYLQTIPHNSAIVLPCALVDETCEDTVKRQYETYLEKSEEMDLCIKK